MAQGKILERKQGSIALASGQTANINSIKIFQTGLVVCIRGYMTGLNVTSGSVVNFGSLQGVDRPTIEPVRYDAPVGDNAWSPWTTRMYWFIGQDGYVSFTAGKTGTNQATYLNIVYIV